MRSVYVVLGCVSIAIGLGWVIAELMNGENIWRRYSGFAIVFAGVLMIRRGMV
jgi:hypothetical protein